jgi:hypothetical protein
MFGKDSIKDLDAYANMLNIDEADYDYAYNSYAGSFRVGNSYLIVHTVAVDDDGRRWSCFWSGDKLLEKKEISYKECKWHYRVEKVHDSDKKEFYGIFRDVKESQHAINQAIIKIQQMVNTTKVLVQEDSVEDVDEFTAAYNRVSGVIPVLNIGGIKVEHMVKEVQDQYIIIDNALTRVQRVLGINESFLGNAYASDSGRKVKLQQNQSIMQLRYLTQRIETFYRNLGNDIVSLVKQYYTATQMFSIVDPIVGERWWLLNKPMERQVGFDPATGQPILAPILLPLYDPANGDVIEDADGNIVLAPVSEPATDLRYSSYTIRVTANAYNDEDEKSQLMLESVMGGQIGNIIAQANPAGFLQIAGLIIKSSKTKYSPSIAQILEQTAQQMTPDVEQLIRGADRSQTLQNSPMSKELKLPQNTNEGI